MKTIIVEDNSINLELLRTTVSAMDAVEVVGTFNDPKKALAYAEEYAVHLALLDIEMPGLDGIALAQKLHELDSRIAIIFLTGHQQYAFDAFQVEAVGYLMKPYQPEEIEKAIHRAALLRNGCSEGRVLVRTFGSFDVFVEGKPIPFRSAKAKELLALLVDRRGGIVTTEQMLATLWEDKDSSDASRSLCRKVIQRLHQTLEAAGVPDLMVSQGRGKCLNVDLVECDYYRFLDGDKGAMLSFEGQYMSDYSWGESTLAALMAKAQLMVGLER